MDRRTFMSIAGAATVAMATGLGRGESEVPANVGAEGNANKLKLSLAKAGRRCAGMVGWRPATRRRGSDSEGRLTSLAHSHGRAQPLVAQPTEDVDLSSVPL